MSFYKIVGNNTKIAWVQATVLMFLFLMPQHLVAQTVLPAQAPAKENAGTSLPATPKWIETATVDLTFKDTDMATMLDKIHEQTGITILREGSPVKADATFTFHGPLKVALDQIAETFDYTWKPAAKLSKALLFNKRFRLPEEHPEWYESEMLHVSEQVCRALQSPFSISEAYGNTRDLLLLLYHKFTPDQLQVLYQGGKLSCQDLNATQTLLLNQQIYSVALGGVNGYWQHLQSQLSHLRDAKLVFRTIGTYKALMLVFPPSVDGKPNSVIMRVYTDAELAQDQAEVTVAPVNMARTLTISVLDGAPENEKRATLQRKLDVRMQGGRMADLMHAVAQRIRCKIMVADYLQNQSLSLWTKGCSVRSLMDLLAEQNEWDWTYTSLTGMHIARHDTFVPANLAEVSAAFQIAMPPSYRHFLGMDIDPEDWLRGDEDPKTKFNRGLRGGNMMTMGRKANFKASSDAIDDPVMQRIWPNQPQKFSNREELTYKEWTPQTKRAVLWSLFALAMRGFFENRGFDVIAGRLTPYERKPELIEIHLIGLKDGQYGLFGYSCTAFDPNFGRINSPGVFLPLKNASAPLSPNLEEISKRY